jgi:outer membrane protein OmpA-like peptidoglycan-associated protein
MKTTQLLLTILFCGMLINLNAQIDIKGKVKNQSTNKAGSSVEQGIDGGLNAVENGVKGLYKKKKNATEPTEPQAEQTEKSEPEAQTQEKVQDEKPAPDSKPTLAVYSKFDFVPGQKIIFYDDFSSDNVGDFPAAWFSNGSGEVVSLNNYPGKWLNVTAPGCYYPERDLQTTENFTVEFDMLLNPPEGESYYVGFYLVSGNVKDPNEGGAVPGVAGVKTNITPTSIDLSGYADGSYAISSTSSEFTLNPGEKVHYSYWIQKQRIRIYVNEKKVVDSPRILPLGYKYNIMRFQIDDAKPFITNFRVAAGLPDTRNKLITEGKLVTYGIYFDVNKDVVKPESYGTLKEIAAALNENPGVRVKIFGHTDSDGDDAKNMDLSKRRAESVKNELAKTFGVDAGRLETDGKGESQPVAPNDTPANKALNRRVEFIKL